MTRMDCTPSKYVHLNFVTYSGKREKENKAVYQVKEIKNSKKLLYLGS